MIFVCSVSLYISHTHAHIPHQDIVSSLFFSRSYSFRLHCAYQIRHCSFMLAIYVGLAKERPKHKSRPEMLCTKSDDGEWIEWKSLNIHGWNPWAVDMISHLVKNHPLKLNKCASFSKIVRINGQRKRLTPLELLIDDFINFLSRLIIQ